MSTFRNWIAKVGEQSRFTLLQKIGRSLRRDSEYPLYRILWKGWIFLRSLMMARLYLWKCDSVGRLVRTRCKPHIENLGQIEIGDSVNINSRNVQTDFVTGPHGKITIGRETSINFGVSIVAQNCIDIGNQVRIGNYSMIFDSDMHIQGERFTHAEGQQVRIEDDAWLATRVIVLKGSLIGEGTVIAAGSVVSGIIPPHTVAAGMPAKVIKKLDTPEARRFWGDELTGQPEIPAPLQERVFRVMRQVWNPETPLSLKLTPHDIDAWDGRSHMELVKALETEFRCSFSKKDVTRMNSVENICRRIRKHGYDVQTTRKEEKVPHSQVTSINVE
ncbi:MAG: acyltransferase [Candidatus Marinimicrobia bacterium]|nr:acyltransferase [Candidatus Neomarinimicrobiota bacterium]